MKEKQELLTAIEVKRAEMNALAKAHPLNSAAVIKVSQELDLLLNQYQKLIDKNKNNISKSGDENV